MAEENTVTMTVENVDQLFSEIVVNGESHVSDRYVPPVDQPQVITPVTEENTPSQQVSEPSEQSQGEDVYAVELNDVLHNFRDDALAYSMTQLEDRVEDVEDLIPAQATPSNQLADKSFVNSSIATNTANFIGTFESVTDLEAYAGTVTNNDYAFVVNEVVQYNGGDFPDVATLNAYDKTLLTNGDYAWVVNSEDNTKYDLYRFDIVEQTWDLRNTKIDKSPDVLNNFFNRYKATVSGSTVTWLYEYTLNNSSFTASQWATINSGLTQQSVDQDIADALAGAKIIVSANETISTDKDVRILVSTSGVTVTLDYSNNDDGVVATVFAFQDCTITYYTGAGTTASLSMSAGTSAVFIYFNGWKYNGIYGAVWN